VVVGSPYPVAIHLVSEPQRYLAFGGGEIFRSLLELRQVDTAEVSVMPVLFGAGVRFLPPPPQIAKLKLSGHRTYGSGIVSLIFDV
jgi:dihydrofolate reductase